MINKDKSINITPYLEIILKYFGKDINHYKNLSDYEEEDIIRQTFNILEKVGFTPTGKIITIEKLVNSISTPCLVYWKQQQFLILEKIYTGLEGDRFHIIEISGKKEYDKKQFLMNWGYIRYDKEEEYRGLIIELF